MELLKQRIRTDGTVKGTDVLKVDSFLNHQMDVELFAEIGKEFLRRFEGCGVNKILTIEASGIGIACVTAQFFHCPVIFAKKSQSKNIDGAVYSTKVESFTHGRIYDVIVSKKFLGPGDKVLIIDDFGVERISPWVQEKFYNIINERYIHKKVTIYTSNVPIEELNYEDRITSRIKEVSYLMEFPEESVRDLIAKQHNKEMFEKLAEEAKGRSAGKSILT